MADPNEDFTHPIDKARTERFVSDGTELEWLPLAEQPAAEEAPPLPTLRPDKPTRVAGYSPADLNAGETAVLDAALGQAPVDETPEARERRLLYARQIAEDRAAGFDVDLPTDWP